MSGHEAELVDTFLPTFYFSWLLARSRMTQARFAGQGQNSGRDGPGSGNGRGQGRGHRMGYMSKPKTSKVGLCKELESNIFDYGISNAANLMCTMQEKIWHYVGIKHGEDIANELTNKTTVTIPPPVYSTAILLRHQEEETDEHEDSIGCEVDTASVRVGNPRCCSYCQSQESSQRRRLSSGPGGTLQPHRFREA